MPCRYDFSAFGRKDSLVCNAVSPSMTVSGNSKRSPAVRRSWRRWSALCPARRLEALIQPHYPVADKGRQPYRLSVILQIHFLQHCYGYSDLAIKDALHDIPTLRRYAGLAAGKSRLPDETTIFNFRHLLEAHQLAESLFHEVVCLLTDPGLILREGTIVDATLIAAPPSTKNKLRHRDPEMTSNKNGNQRQFAMKAHIGADTAHGLVHMRRSRPKFNTILKIRNRITASKSAPIHAGDMEIKPGESCAPSTPMVTSTHNYLPVLQPTNPNQH